MDDSTKRACRAGDLRRYASIPEDRVCSLSSRRAPLFVEPDVLHPAVAEDAVDDKGEILDVGLPAGRAAVVEDDRAGAVLGEAALDLPDDRLALFRIRLG